MSAKVSLRRGPAGRQGRAAVQKFGLWCGLWLCLMLALGQPQLLAKPVIKLEASPRELALGESLQLNLTLIQEANEQGAMVEAPSLALPELAGFDVLGQQSSSSMLSTNNRLRMIVQSQYRLRPLKTGELTIPSLTFLYSENGRQQELVTQPVTIRVKGASPATGLIWFAGGVLVLLAGALLLRRRVRPALTATAAPAPVALPDGLDGFEARLAAGEDPSRLLEELYAWFRALAARRGWAPAAGITHQEMLQALRFESGLPGAKLQAIEAFLQACDQMRFANHEVAPQRFLDLLALARRFC